MSESFEADSAKSVTPAPATPLRVLLVEDHADTAEVLTTLLVAYGYSVRTAANISQAVAHAAESEFDVVVSDLGLPDGTGYDLLKRLNAIQPMKSVAMSGYGVDDEIHKSMDAGFCEHLVKPVSMHDLHRAIRRAVGRAGSE